MSTPLLEKIASANSDLLLMLEQTRRALAGQRDFDVELVRKLSSLVAEMDPVLSRSRELRLEQPALAIPLNHYVRLATELRSELDKAQIMLLARRSSLDAARTQLLAVGLWTSALSSTR